MRTVLSVAHTGITMRRLDEAVFFWVEALGAKLERSFELGGEFAAEVTDVAVRRSVPRW